MESHKTLLPAITNTVQQLILEFERISDNRKTILEALARFVQNRIDAGEATHLNFICTHNSRRSHIAQIWAQTAAYHYNISNVKCFSGGTEATAFNARAVKALQEAGFYIIKVKEGDNPVYEVQFSLQVNAIKAFSKRYDDAVNPKQNFAAVMTCSHADENCPLVLGATQRIALTYDDPKDFDGTPQEEGKYRERVYEIGREILWAFSKVKMA